MNVRAAWKVALQVFSDVPGNRVGARRVTDRDVIELLLTRVEGQIWSNPIRFDIGEVRTGVQIELYQTKGLDPYGDRRWDAGTKRRSHDFRTSPCLVMTDAAGRSCVVAYRTASTNERVQDERGEEAHRRSYGTTAEKYFLFFSRYGDPEWGEPDNVLCKESGTRLAGYGTSEFTEISEELVRALRDQVEEFFRPQHNSDLKLTQQRRVEPTREITGGQHTHSDPAEPETISDSFANGVRDFFRRLALGGFIGLIGYAIFSLVTGRF